MSFLSEKRHKYSNFYNTNKEYYLWFEDFPTPAFLRFSSVDMYISTIIYVLYHIRIMRSQLLRGRLGTLDDIAVLIGTLLSCYCLLR